MNYAEAAEQKPHSEGSGREGGDKRGAVIFEHKVLGRRRRIRIGGWVKGKAARQIPRRKVEGGAETSGSEVFPS